MGCRNIFMNLTSHLENIWREPIPSSIPSESAAEPGKDAPQFLKSAAAATTQSLLQCLIYLANAM
jgi:hypothetical protein